MQCSKAQTMVEAFIADELDIEDKADFVRHIRGCNSCREDLEVFQVIYSVVRQLDEDVYDDIKYVDEVNARLERSEADIKKRIYYRRVRMSIFFVICVLLLCMIYFLI